MGKKLTLSNCKRHHTARPRSRSVGDKMLETAGKFPSSGDFCSGAESTAGPPPAIMQGPGQHLVRQLCGAPPQVPPPTPLQDVHPTGCAPGAGSLRGLLAPAQVSTRRRCGKRLGPRTIPCGHRSRCWKEAVEVPLPRRMKAWQVALLETPPSGRDDPCSFALNR